MSYPICPILSQIHLDALHSSGARYSESLGKGRLWNCCNQRVKEISIETPQEEACVILIMLKLLGEYIIAAPVRRKTPEEKIAVKCANIANSSVFVQPVWRRCSSMSANVQEERGQVGDESATTWGKTPTLNIRGGICCINPIKTMPKERGNCPPPINRETNVDTWGGLRHSWHLIGYFKPTHYLRDREKDIFHQRCVIYVSKKWSDIIYINVLVINLCGVNSTMNASHQGLKQKKKWRHISLRLKKEKDSFFFRLLL